MEIKLNLKKFNFLKFIRLNTNMTTSKSDIKNPDYIPTTTNEFLSLYRLSAEDRLTTRITHTALPNPGVKTGGSFHIPTDKLEDFLKAYAKDVFEGNQIFHLTEAHHPEVSPILIDLDFRQKIEDNPEIKKVYTHDDIKVYLKEYHRILSQYIDEQDLKENEIAFVMEKKNASKGKGNEIKDGVHIVYPQLCPSYKIQFLARYDMIKSDVVNDLFKKIKTTNDTRNVIDHSVIRNNNWFMYGSTKPGSEPYIITAIYEMGTGECVPQPLKNWKAPLKTLKYLSISYKKTLTPIKYGIDESVKQKYQLLPNQDKDNSEKHNHPSQKKSSTPIDSSIESRKANKNKVDDKEYDLIDKLTRECLSGKRATLYEDWIRVCWCLSNIDYRLEEAFVEFSRKAPSGKFDEVGCRNEWARSQTRIMERRLGVGTLHKWAKEDNPTKYREISRDSLGKLMYCSMNKTHSDIARYIYEKLKHEFKCSSISHSKWYHYMNNRWVHNERGNNLKKKISSEVSHDYSDYSTFCNNKSNEFRDDEPEKDNWQHRARTAADIAIQLKKTAFKNSVFTECQELFFDEKFEDELDSNDNLLHFLNGVYDLDKNEFREGYPEDNISLTTGINYIEQLDSDDYEKMTQVEELINKILPIERVRNYVLNLLASFLHGANKEQKFHIWTGVGSNGKSMLIDFYKKTIGDYYGSMSITSLTQGRSGAENASPVLAETRGRRFISLDEAETNDEIKVGFMKQLTGGDEITARKLHSSPITFRPKFKLVLTCNELPSIPANDEGTWRRIRVVEFISKFCDSPDPKKPYEFVADRGLQSKLSGWSEIFMYMLIQYYQNSYVKNGIQEPPEVLKNTASYRSDSDIYSQFVEEFLREDANSCLSIDDIFPIFRGFLQQNNINQSKHTRLELEKRLNKIIGKANTRKKWKGWKVAPNDDDDDEVNDDN
jgi:P4 family phage/plasmid primase-like protien